MDISSVDLNLLLAFDVLMTERSVTRAAAKLNMSQPAMSGALARLRVWFGDPLFVRTRGQMRPTARAQQLAGPIAEAIATLREAIEPAPAFRFQESTRMFMLSASDYVEALLLGPLMTGIRRAAPLVSLRTIRPAHVFMPPDEPLRVGELDVALGLYAATLRARGDFLTQVLYRDRFVGVVRERHPGVGRTLTLKTFLSLPHIRIVYPGEVLTGLVDSVLASQGHKRDAALTVSSLVPVPAIVAGSDLLGIVPERLARAWARARPIRILDIPIALPDLPLTMVWHATRHSDPANQWLRDLIGRTFTEDSVRHSRRRT